MKRGTESEIFKSLIHKFYSTFGVKLMDYFDKGLLHCGVLMFDIISFDDWLHKKYGDYELKNKSMKDIIIENYGIEASELIECLIDKVFVDKDGICFNKLRREQ